MTTLKFLIPIFILLNTNHNFSLRSSENALAEKVVSSLKSKNVKEFELLIITYQDYERHILPGYKNQSKNRIPEAMIQESNEFYKNKNNIELLKIKFSEILKQGKLIGIDDWSKVKFVSFKSMIIKSSQLSEEQRNNIIGDIIISYNNVNFCIYNVTMRKIEDAYKLGLLYGISKCEKS